MWSYPVTSVSSDDARRRFRELMDSVEHQDAHVTVLRYSRPAAVIVPIEWYEQVKGLLENGERS
jgi:prevent-host-death family protein